jgi:hypothetical protein
MKLQGHGADLGSKLLFGPDPINPLMPYEAPGDFMALIR